jgi:acyl carrier protein
MTETEVKEIVIQALRQIAPDMEPEKLLPDDILRKNMEIDSFEALRLVVALDEKFGIATPEEPGAACRYSFRKRNLQSLF